MLANESVLVEIVISGKVSGKISKNQQPKKEANATTTLESAH